MAFQRTHPDHHQDFAVTGFPCRSTLSLTTVYWTLVTGLSSAIFPGDIRRWGTVGASSLGHTVSISLASRLLLPELCGWDYTRRAGGRQARIRPDST